MTLKKEKYLSNLEKNVVSSIDGANALKLDETFEIKNIEEQNTLINNYESNEENQIQNENLDKNHSMDELPTGVSIESASYMENNVEEEHTPKLFSDEQSQMDLDQNDLKKEDDGAQNLFDQETNEDEDFEIPAFLRRQKF